MLKNVMDLVPYRVVPVCVMKEGEDWGGVGRVTRNGRESVCGVWWRERGRRGES